MDKKCELCEEKATRICFKCFMYYCDSCFKYIHSKNQKQEHMKEKIDPFISINTKCNIHPDNIINLFCVEEKSNLYLN